MFGRGSKRNSYFRYYKKQQGILVLLRETKLAIMEDAVVRSLWPNPSVLWVAVDANNSTGGIIILWDSSPGVLKQSLN